MDDYNKLILKSLAVTAHFKKWKKNKASISNKAKLFCIKY